MFFNGGKEICIGFVMAKKNWLTKKLYFHFQLPIDVLTSVFINNLPSFKCKKLHLHGANGPSIFLQVKDKNLPLKSTHRPLNEITSSWGSLNRHFLIVKTFIESHNIVWGTSPTIISQSWIFIIIFLKVGEITCDMPRVMEICYEVICNIYLNASRSSL